LLIFRRQLATLALQAGASITPIVAALMPPASQMRGHSRRRLSPYYYDSIDIALPMLQRQPRFALYAR